MSETAQERVRHISEQDDRGVYATHETFEAAIVSAIDAAEQAAFARGRAEAFREAATTLRQIDHPHDTWQICDMFAYDFECLATEAERQGDEKGT